MTRTLPQIRCQGRSNCNACSLRREMVCSDVSLDSLVDFHAGIEDLEFGSGARLFDAGAPADAVFCIRAGEAKMVHLEPNGSVRIVRVLRTGDVAGIEACFREQHEFSSIAIGRVSACRIPMGYFRRFIGEHPALQRRLMEMSHAALSEAQTWLSQFVGGSIPARVRLARLLLALRVGGEDRILRFTGEDMAAILGVTFETVSRATSELTRLGILQKDRRRGGGYFRGDIAALERIAREA